MKRGEVWWVNFDPSIGGEIRKRRPAIIISNDAANRHLNRIQVVPLISQVKNIYPSEVVVMIGDRQSKAMADQLATLSKRQLVDQVGELTHADMRKVEHVVKVQLGLLGKGLEA